MLCGFDAKCIYRHPQPYPFTKLRTSFKTVSPRRLARGSSKKPVASAFRGCFVTGSMLDTVMERGFLGKATNEGKGKSSHDTSIPPYLDRTWDCRVDGFLLRTRPSRPNSGRRRFSPTHHDPVKGNFASSSARLARRAGAV